MKRLPLAECVLFLLVFALRADAQPDANNPKEPPKKAAMPVEKVEGFWPVMGYCGGKLTDELGQRLNLSDKKSSEGDQPKWILKSVRSKSPAPKTASGLKV